MCVAALAKPFGPPAHREPKEALGRMSDRLQRGVSAQDYEETLTAALESLPQWINRHRADEV